jgi:hypothetical protein
MMFVAGLLLCGFAAGTWFGAIMMAALAMAKEDDNGGKTDARLGAGAGKRGGRQLDGDRVVQMFDAGRHRRPDLVASSGEGDGGAMADHQGGKMLKELNKRIRHIELPENMRRVPISDEGYPVPWFVGYRDGKPDFRTMDGEKMSIAVRLKRCWMCGKPLGVHMTFPIGPMCAVNRNIAEPPSHHSCALYGVLACPFLTQPRMKRNEKDPIVDGHIAGHGLKRNPGVTCLWTTRSYKTWRPPGGGVLFSLGDPEKVEYYAEGRRATRDEVMASMESGLPLLMKVAEDEGPDAVAALKKMYAAAVRDLVPA